VYLQRIEPSFRRLPTCSPVPLMTTISRLRRELTILDRCAGLCVVNLGIYPCSWRGTNHKLRNTPTSSSLSACLEPYPLVTVRESLNIFSLNLVFRSLSTPCCYNQTSPRVTIAQQCLPLGTKKCRNFWTVNC